MALDFNRLIALWAAPVPAGEAGLAAFRRVYSDPVRLNGTETPLAAVVERARATQQAFADLKAVVLTQVDTPTHSTVVFRMSGRHVGRLSTPLGDVPATGKVVDRQIIDLLGHHDGVIHEIWMVGDELGALSRLGVIRLT